MRTQPAPLPAFHARQKSWQVIPVGRPAATRVAAITDAQSTGSMTTLTPCAPDPMQRPAACPLHRGSTPPSRGGSPKGTTLTEPEAPELKPLIVPVLAASTVPEWLPPLPATAPPDAPLLDEPPVDEPQASKNPRRAGCSRRGMVVAPFECQERAIWMAFSSSALVGSTFGSNRPMFSPVRPTANLVKFHLISPPNFGFVSGLVSYAKSGSMPGP